MKEKPTAFPVRIRETQARFINQTLERVFGIIYNPSPEQTVNFFWESLSGAKRTILIAAGEQVDNIFRENHKLAAALQAMANKGVEIKIIYGPNDQISNLRTAASARQALTTPNPELLIVDGKNVWVAKPARNGQPPELSIIVKKTKSLGRQLSANFFTLWNNTVPLK